MTDNEVADRFARLPALVNSRTALIRRGRFFSATFLIGAGGVPVHVTVRDGAVAEVALGPALLRSWCFAIRAPADAWARFWEPAPPPGFHDLFAMVRFGHARIEGELQPLMANLRYVKELLTAPRAGAGAGGDVR